MTVNKWVIFGALGARGAVSRPNKRDKLTLGANLGVSREHVLQSFNFCGKWRFRTYHRNLELSYRLREYFPLLMGGIAGKYRVGRKARGEMNLPAVEKRGINADGVVNGR